MIRLVVEAGKCRVCGCTELNPCMSRGGDGEPIETCAWLDFDHTLCTNLRCVALTPLADLLEMPLLQEVA
jgi:hypothetical protein